MTSTTSPDPSILKTDTLGRVRTPLEKREKILEEFDRSGLSAAKFAEVIGVKYQTFATWLQKRRKKGLMEPITASDSMQWLEAVVDPSCPKGPKGVTVQLPGGISVEVTDLAQIDLAVALVRALSKSC